MNAQIRPSPRRPGPLKRLIRPLVKPDVFDFWATRLHRTWTWERPLARLVARESASADAVTLLFKPNRHWAGHRAGQHVNLGIEIDGVRLTRSYSLTSPPRADGLLPVTVKAIEGGKVSRYLHSTARIGEIVELGQAFGDMTLPAAPTGAYLMLAAGSGITPLMALVRELAGQGMPVGLTLLYWVRRREEACFLDELRTLAAAHPGFRFRLLLTREAASAGDEAEGRIDDTVLSAQAGDPATQQVIACGPGGFVETARGLLASRAASFQAEAFTAPPVLVVDEGEVDILLQRSGRTLRVPRGESLLVALEQHGLKPPSGCRMGICNTCACGKSAGSTRHLPSGDLMHEPTQALKLCIHSAATDIELDL
ncbi:ferredoxin-NADP reductase [Pseudoxanthomonas sp. 3HH-4]|uniref:ferredoxin reductase n=1 Tax=Pseudoxanthomonas sp. 3HH-4 TaxID=1690214 RepID=UPI001150196F|nr:ferredoxin reductase [Pseudoxanthomonas sp. 3HH-4]TQM10291.1 ferredoxin-NADP reductase [Pseudoxanthomonas sp. 3HH-4]